MPDPRYYSGDDNRDELTEPDPAPCESCGALPDDPCDPGCGCKWCRMKALDIDPELSPVGVTTTGGK